MAPAQLGTEVIVVARFGANDPAVGVIDGGSALAILTVTDFGGLDVGIPQAMRRSIDFAANSHGIGAG